MKRNLDFGGPCGILGSAMRDRRIATWVVLTLCILLGPMGMALSGCMMMDGCDVLCSVPSAAPILPSDLSVARTALSLLLAVVVPVPQNVWTVLDSPPKPAPILL